MRQAVSRLWVLVAATLIVTSLGWSAGVAPAAASERSYVTAGVDKPAATAGSMVSVRGQVAPQARRTVVLQLRSSGRWVDLAIRKTMRRGAYAFDVAAGNTARTLLFRVSVPRSGAYRATMSRTLAVTVTVPPGPTVPETPTEPEVPTVPEVPTPPAPTPGTLGAPYSVGQTFALVDWRISLGVTDLDAWPEIQAENMFNEPPGVGWSYVLVPVTLENAGPKEMTPWLEVNVEFLGRDGVIYGAMSDDQYCGVVPSSLLDVNDVYPGGRVTANQCAAVPSAALAGGHWRVSTYDARLNRRSAFVTIS